MNKTAKIALLASMGGIYFSSFFQRVAVPGTIFDELQSAYGLSASGMAALSTIYLYLYGGLQPLAGVLADSWGAGRTILLSGLLLVVGSLLFPLSSSLAMLYGTRVLIGIGAAMIYVSLIKEVDELFGEKEFPLFMSLGVIMGYAGGLFATYPFERLVRLQGWRTSLTEVGLICLVCVAGAAVLFYRAGRLRERRGVRFGGAFRTVLGNRPFYPLLLCCAVNFALYFLLQATIGKKFLQDNCGMSSGDAALFTFIMMLACMTGILLSGFGAARFRRRKPFVMAASLCALAAVLLLWAGVQWKGPRGLFLAGYLLLALSSSITPVLVTMAKEMNPREASGTAVGILNAAAYIAVALVTSLAGFVLDAFSREAVVTPTAVVYPMAAYKTLFGICGGLAAVSLFASLRTRETAAGAAPAPAAGRP